MVRPEPQQATASLFGEYMGLFRARFWGIVATGALAAVGSLVVSLLLTPVYVAEAQVLVTPSGVGLETQPLNIENERALAESSITATRVARELQLRASAEELQQGLTVLPLGSAPGLTFSYESADPQEARVLAQAFATTYLEIRSDRAREAAEDQRAVLEGQLAELESRFRQASRHLDDSPPPAREAIEVRLSSLADQVATIETAIAGLPPPQELPVGEIVDPATTPPEPVRPDIALNVVVGLVVGLGLAFAVVLIRSRPRLSSA